MIVKYNICLQTLLQQGISEPVFYGNLVYTLKRVVGKPNYIDQFKMIIKRYKRVGYNMDTMRQSACLVVNHGGSGLRLNNGQALICWLVSDANLWLGSL